MEEKLTERQIEQIAGERIFQRLCNYYKDHELLDMGNAKIECASTQNGYSLKVSIPPRDFDDVYSCRRFLKHFIFDKETTSESIALAIEQEIERFEVATTKWFRAIRVASKYIDMEEPNRELTEEDFENMTEAVEYAMCKILGYDTYDLDSKMEVKPSIYEYEGSEFIDIDISLRSREDVVCQCKFDHEMEFEAQVSSFRIAFVEFIQALVRERANVNSYIYNE